LWELDNPKGFNLFIASVYFYRSLNDLHSVRVPIFTDLIKGTQFPINAGMDITIVGSKRVSKLPYGSCVVFSNMNDAMAFCTKACGEIIQDNRGGISSTLYASSTTFKLK
jgi:hypothetical protein